MLSEDEYHAEIVMDATERTLTAFILGGDAKTAQSISETTVPVKLEVGDATEMLTLSAEPQEGDAEEQSSRFGLGDASIPESIKDEEDLHGMVAVTIDGMELAGEVTHGHGHDH